MRSPIFLLLFFTATVSFPCLAQTRTITLLKNKVQEAKTPAEKQQALLALCDQGYTLQPDTLLAYASQAMTLAQENHHRRNEIEALYFLSYAYTNKGLIDSSLALANVCEAVLQKEIHDPILLANVLNQKGRCYMRKNQYKQAISMGYAVINKAEEGGDVLLQIKGKTLIGWAYLEMGQTQEALRWHVKALHTTNDESILQQYGILFANIALNYNALRQKDSAFHYIQKAIVYSRRSENLFALSNSLAIEAQLFVTSGQNQKAEAPLKEVVEIRKLIGDPFYIVSDMAQLALYYSHNGQPQKGIALCLEGLNIAQRYHIETKLFFLYTTLADNYKAANNLMQYATVMEKLVALKDSVYQTNSAQALAEMQARYDVQKKENIIIQQKLDLVMKNYWIYGALGFSLLIAGASFLLLKSYRRKQQLKMQLMQQQEKQKTEQAITEAEEAERKRIAADLHDSLGAFAASIALNIDNLDAHIVYNKQTLQELRRNSQAIVAQLNDTIWVLKKDALLLTAISDRLKVFIQRLQTTYVGVTMDVWEDVEIDHLLPPSKAFHLFQMMKEAIINALKHSSCTQIEILIKAHESWRISIADNGSGFVRHTTLAEGGNGLVNMQERAKESGYKIEWRHNAPQGTKIIIEPTTN